MIGRAAALALALPALAAAHPLGNFTVNRWAALHVGAHAVAIRYVVDMAEIPAFQEIARIDANRNGTIDPAERDAYLTDEPALLARGLVVTVDGVPIPLAGDAASLELPPGAGGLPTLRLEASWTAALAVPPAVVELHDRNFAGRAGWREVIADADEGLALAESSVPRADRSDALRAYPADLLATPPQVSEARLRLASGSGAPPAETRRASLRLGSLRFSDRMTELVSTRRPLGVGLVLTSLLVAAALGGLHALGPGHGKTIVGAWLVGARGTARDAVVLGLVVTATHTAVVYLLGAGTLVASRWIVPERLFPWMSAVSGLLVVGVGATLLRTRLAVALGMDAGHHHGDHAHHDGHRHDHGHDGGHGHVHLPPPGSSPGWRRLVALGVSGGLLPCPSALVVMLGAIALGRIAFGLVLIVAFSAGLAGVLTAVGLAFVWAERWFDHLSAGGRVMRYVPVASAVVISLAGLLIVARALVDIGILGTA
jgi:nickel/cobalt transporter (NicO) family protein